MRSELRVWAGALAMIIVAFPGLSRGQSAAPVEPPLEALPLIPEDATEDSLVTALRRLSIPLESKGPAEAGRLLRETQQRWILAYADALLERFPQTSHREEVLVAKLGAFALLARTDVAHLGKLLRFTEEIEKANPSETLAAENAFYAIQAFVMGARLENMPREKQLQGTIERYHAFLDDYQRSPRRPVVHASLVRNLIALDAIERAEKQFRQLRAEFPQDEATHHARNELLRARSLGKPLAFSLSEVGGEKLESRLFFGKVLVLRLWGCGEVGAVALDSEGGKGLSDAQAAVVDACVQQGELPGGKETTPPMHVLPLSVNQLALEQLMAFPLPVVYVLDREGVLRAVGADESVMGEVRRLIDSVPPASEVEKGKAPESSRE